MRLFVFPFLTCLMVAASHPRNSLADVVGVDSLGAADGKAIRARTISGDGAHIAEIVSVSDKVTALRLDGREVARDAQIRSAYLNNDGSRLAYTVFDGAEWFVVVADQRFGPYDELGSFFAPYDGRGLFNLGYHYNEVLLAGSTAHFAFTARRDAKWVVMHDGQEVASYDETSDKHESPVSDVRLDEAQFAFAVETGPGDLRAQCWMVNGKAETAYQQVWPLVFDQTGRYLYRARVSKEQVVLVADGKKVAAFLDIPVGPVLSLDRKHDAFVGSRASNDPLGQSDIVVVDNREFPMLSLKKPGTSYSLVDLAVNRDGTHFAAVELSKTLGADPIGMMKMQMDLNIFVDGSIAHQHVGWVEGLALSDDGNRVAFCNGADNGQYVNVGDEHGPDYQEVTNPIFSRDGKHVAYGARNAQGWMVVVDRHEVPQFELLPSYPFDREDLAGTVGATLPYHFDDKNELNFIARHADQNVLVHYQP